MPLFETVPTSDTLAQKYGLEIPKEFYYQLPKDDPHKLYTPEERRAMAEARKREREEIKRLQETVGQAIETLEKAGYVQSAF